eukprot:13079948-Ditylum_brightwellii.AAC.1
MSSSPNKGDVVIPETPQDCDDNIVEETRFPLLPALESPATSDPAKLTMKTKYRQQQRDSESSKKRERQQIQQSLSKSEPLSHVTPQKKLSTGSSSSKEN